MPVVNLATGEATESVELKAGIFGAKVRSDLLHQMVVWHLANRRAGLASVRTREGDDDKTIVVKTKLIEFICDVVWSNRRKEEVKWQDRRVKYLNKKERVTPVWVRCARHKGKVREQPMVLIRKIGVIRSIRRSGSSQ